MPHAEVSARLMLMVRPRRVTPVNYRAEWWQRWEPTVRQIDPARQADYQRLAHSPADIWGQHPLALVLCAVLVAAVLFSGGLHVVTAAAALLILLCVPLFSHWLYRPQRRAAQRVNLLFARGQVKMPEREEIEVEALPSLMPLSTRLTRF